jgi:DNA-binding XRE family transcriptional regulator
LVGDDGGEVMSKIMSNRIQVYRKQASMRQQALADELGINRTYLSKLENYVHNPSPDLMIKLCEVFECDLGDMFTIQEEN